MNKKTPPKIESTILKEDDILYFLHIPKTAGLTMIYLLQTVY